MDSTRSKYSRLPKPHTDEFRTQLTPGQLVWRRFRKHRMALLGSGGVILMVLFIFIGSIIVPLEKANQVDLFARPLAWNLGLPYHDQVLRRAREETSQVKLTAEARHRNVLHAFEVVEISTLPGRQILLVDDVATTGSTAGACAQVLREHGAKAVYVATLARSLLRKSNQEVA